jgi:flagellar M-ring protein FliF
MAETPNQLTPRTNLGPVGRVLDQFRAFSAIPMVRQLIALASFSGAIALAVGSILWTQEPNWRQLEAGLPLQEQAQVLDVLTGANIEYSLGTSGTVILVPADRLYEAKMLLATSGMPAAPPEGYEILDQDQGLGASRRMESSRFRRALEGELARSIESLAGVQTARVHLAIPERSVFIRTQAAPSSSVILSRYRGGQLSARQIAGIQKLVAASVPDLSVDDVAVLDPSGALLSIDKSDVDANLSTTQYALKRQIEGSLVSRIQGILAPLLGPEGVRAEVAAEMDFTSREVTRETYSPDGGPGAVRSERSQRQRRPEGGGGVPGALTNSPPPGGRLEENAPEDGSTGLAAEELQADVTRNYELDKEIEYSRPSPGQVTRLSVAVVINALSVDEESGERPARTEAELANLEAIIRDAVGFNPDRGDSITIREVPFVEFEAEPFPEPEPQPFWTAAWFEELVRQVLTGAALLSLVLFVLRPFTKWVMSLPVPPPPPILLGEQQVRLPAPSAVAAPGDAQLKLPGPRQDDINEMLQEAQTVADNDPRRIAQLTRQWMNTGG